MVSDSASVPSCSVVICTRDRPEDLNRCIGAVANQDYPRFDVLVVDNAPSQGRAREVARRWGVRYTVEPVTGLSRARNRGLSECQSEIAAYVDDDAVAQRGWLAGLAVEFNDPEVMAVTGRIIPLTAQADGGTPWAAATDRGLVRRCFDRRTDGWFALANFGAIGIGANMAVRRSVVGAWRGFDPRLGRGSLVPGGEENYAFYELINLGYRVIYAPAAVVRHHTPSSYEEARTCHLKTLLEAGAYLAFLFAEQPQQRKLIGRFLVNGLRGQRQTSRTTMMLPGGRLAPRWRELLAGARGAASYAGRRLWQRGCDSPSTASRCAGARQDTPRRLRDIDPNRP